jgi:hypothetical protein
MVNFNRGTGIYTMCFIRFFISLIVNSLLYMRTQQTYDKFIGTEHKQQFLTYLLFVQNA